jgi:hypothetical protein
MVDVSIELDGLKGFIKQVAKFSKTNEEVHPAFKESEKAIKRDLQKYPAPKPTYQRTFKLRRSWHYRSPRKGGLIGRFYSEGVSYAKYVQDEKTQAWMHRGHWLNTIQHVTRNREAEVVRIFNRVLNEAVK